MNKQTRDRNKIGRVDRILDGGGNNCITCLHFKTIHNSDYARCMNVECKRNYMAEARVDAVYYMLLQNEKNGKKTSRVNCQYFQ